MTYSRRILGLRLPVLAILLLVAGSVAVLLMLWGARSPSRYVVDTRAPKIGVHTRLTDEVEAWKIDRTFQMVREMGASWAVEYFPWPYVEPRPGSFDWAHADLVVDSAWRQGLTLVARLDGVPEWARPKDTPSRYLDASAYGRFADFVAAFADRYGDKVAHFIIWNEPNLAFEWGFRPPNAAEYADLLSTVYPRLKQVRPDAQVLMAGLAPVAESTDLAVSDLEYLQRLLDAGAGQYCDAFAVHAYGWKFPPDDPAEPARVNFARTELIHDLLVRNGEGSKTVLITEGGWNDHPRWTKAVRPAQRVEYTVRAYEKAQLDWEWCSAVALWAFRLPQPSHSYNDYFTFVDNDFNPKPVYEAVRRYARGG